MSPLNYVVINTSNTGAGSLSEAITYANANYAITDLITFHIEPTGAHTIPVVSALPTITDSVVINGTTQSGFVDMPIIELNGAGAGAGTSGLRIAGGTTTVRGLVINRFGGLASP